MSVASAAVFSRLPLEQIVRGPWREPFLAIWASAEVAIIAMVVSVGGGVVNPLVILFAVPPMFGALAFRLPTMAAVGAIDIVAFLTVAILAGNPLAPSLFGAFALVGVVAVSAWVSHAQVRRRQALAEAARALGESERKTRRQARQQAVVAGLGARALAGDEIELLSRDLVEAVCEGIEVDVCGVLRIDSELQMLVNDTYGSGGSFEGEPERVPLGLGSQAGYAIATGAPVVVSDWATETRFEQAAVLTRMGMVSGVAVPIRAGLDVYGVLGAQSRSRRTFGSEDLSFLQALANVLGSAVARRAEELRTRHDALHDPLTGLPNRSLFRDRLEHALSRARRHGHDVAVLFLDLDEFKLVNDSLGHASGDRLLEAIAPRLDSAVRASDTVARFGGDEFVILMEEVDEAEEALQMAERITAELSRPFDLDQQYFVSASIGIAVAGGDAEPEALLRDSDTALYEAKHRGRGSCALFGAASRERILSHVQIETGLRHALERGELELHYQPVVRLADCAVVAVEALVRWRDPERGLLMPDQFIPIAEQVGLIEPIGRWVLDTACGQAVRWQAADPDGPPLGIGVNLSAGQLATGQATASVASAIEASGIDPATVRLELTESTLVENWDAAESSVAALKRLGARLVLDDFGSGFSSLTYLKRLPLDSVKLDRGFVENLYEGSRDLPVVRAVIELGRALDFTVVAEGIETAEQLRTVEELGCGYAQGFYFARPMPAPALEAWLARARREGALVGERTRFEWGDDPRREGARPPSPGPPTRGPMRSSP